MKKIYLIVLCVIFACSSFILIGVIHAQNSDRDVPQDKTIESDPTNLDSPLGNNDDISDYDEFDYNGDGFISLEELQSRKSTVENNQLSDALEGNQIREIDKIRSNRALTQEQKNALSKLDAEGLSYGSGRYLRKEAEILGLIDVDGRRITLAEVKSMIVEEKNLIYEISKIIKYPDFEGGSGIHRIVYFLDATGNESIELSFSGLLVTYTNLEKGISETLKS